ncbi:hypothetical protein [Rathayibacter sp. VKM Ac-2857]|uniref:hypothetical protein n=1 Tax=Rathayibacter sp. VKM Ac-2857 TaxID=2739020 RepID=UPI0015644C6A|nr:hypothetical protein [Rathayibacter sp. VKM Ac-2857]NQX18335.1 hypothetical protein [Rathayibacter sp. VKM Ac-2857]
MAETAPLHIGFRFCEPSPDGATEWTISALHGDTVTARSGTSAERTFPQTFVRACADATTKAVSAFE